MPHHFTAHLSCRLYVRAVHMVGESLTFEANPHLSVISIRCVSKDQQTSLIQVA